MPRLLASAKKAKKLFFGFIINIRKKPGKKPKE
jgi:hypothetical protein